MENLTLEKWERITMRGTGRNEIRVEIGVEMAANAPNMNTSRKKYGVYNERGDDFWKNEANLVGW